GFTRVCERMSIPEIVFDCQKDSTHTTVCGRHHFGGLWRQYHGRIAYVNPSASLPADDARTAPHPAHGDRPLTVPDAPSHHARVGHAPHPTAHCPRRARLSVGRLVQRARWTTPPARVHTRHHRPAPAARYPAATAAQHAHRPQHVPRLWDAPRGDARRTADRTAP